MDKRTVIAIAASLALGAGSGYFAGSRSSEPAIELPIIAGAPSAAPQATDSEPAADTPAKISTVREILQLKGDFAQTTALYLLASQADSKSIERLLQEAEAITAESDRRAATGILYTRLAELDPERAVQRVMASAELDLASLQTVFQTWSRLDLQRALTRAAALEDERSKTVALRSIIAVRSELSTAEREALARKYNVRMGVPGERVVMDVRTEQSAERSWRATLAVKDSMQRESQLGQLAYLWGKQSPEAALRSIEQIDDLGLRSRLLLQSMNGWAERSPQEALDWALARKPSQERAQMLSIALRSKLKEDPRAVMSQVEQLSYGERQQVLPQLLSQWARDDVQAAADWVTSLKDEQLRSSAIYSIASNYAARSPEEALRWATMLPKAQSQFALPTIISQVAQKDPARGLAMLNSVQDPGQRDSAAVSVAQSWAQRDPAAAALWATRLPDTPNRPYVLETVFGTWASYDMAGATQQVNQLTDPGVRDGALAALVSNDFVEPAQATQFYNRIESKEVKARAALRLYVKVRESDPALAEQLRQDMNISSNYGRTRSN
jgi:hypothetical protein